MKNLCILVIALTMFSSCSSSSGKRATGPKTFIKGTVTGVSKVKKYDNGSQSYTVLIDKDSNGVADVEFLISESNPTGVLLHKTQVVTLVLQQGQVTN